MAPSPRAPDGIIHRTPGYEDFIAKLTAYHQKRGTNFDPSPKVGTKHVDLKVLFDTVIEAGGYDKVSEVKLEWRKIGDLIGLDKGTDAAKAFSLKTTYYKYLAAYEISTIHGKEPPPREILEDISAAGAALLTRTMENYRVPNRRETGNLGAGDSENSGDEGTPIRDRKASEETPGSGGGRATRGLRQAPPQRVLFQPDTAASRQPRHHQQQTQLPPPPTQHHHHHSLQQPPQAAAPAVNVPRGASSSYNPSSHLENLSSTVSNYEPRQQAPFTLRPVTTPGNNHAEFTKRQRLLREQANAANGSVATVSPNVMLPGAGFEGPNIYVRCLFALRSGTPAEKDYALHHLVKISMERGDKYRFESFPGLAEALIEEVLEVSSLFYDVKWCISYTEENLHSINTLCGLRPTADILDRIASIAIKPFDENVHPAELSDKLLLINEAALTLRNMVMLEENATYVSDLYPLRDFLSIALNLPDYDCVVELKHYALEIAEQLTKNMSFEPEDPLYMSLLAQVQRQDRGAILTSLRAISRISMNLPEANRLKGVPTSMVENIVNWLLLEDEELLHACLDFLYQFTAVVDNVDAMNSGALLENLVNQLVRLLTHGAKLTERMLEGASSPRTRSPQEILPVPADLMEQLLKLEETERSSRWLRCLFEEDPHESITQILLWQSYQSTFSQALTERGLANMLSASEFIKNVGATFSDKASAQVQNGPVPKFIIKGIRIRDTPVDFTGKPYSTCKWIVNSPSTPGVNKECSEYLLGPERMFDHLMIAHLGAQKGEGGKFDNVGLGEYVCYWRGCGKYLSPVLMQLSHMARHIQHHVRPNVGPPPGSPDSSGKSRTGHKPSTKQTFLYHETAKDERNEAAGIPLTAVLVLRNLVRVLPKIEANEKNTKPQASRSLVENLFKGVEPKLWEVMAHNRRLSIHISELFDLIQKAAQ